MLCTKDQPGYWSSMLSELAKIDQVKTKKKIHFKSIEAARKAKIKFSEMIFTINNKEIYCISVGMVKSVKTIFFTQFNIPISDYTSGVFVWVDKSIKDYASQPKHIGSYKYCEGGGWYSKANLYELNGKYYTDAY